MKKILVMGLGLGDCGDWLPAHPVIASAGLVVGGAEQLRHLQGLGLLTLAVTGDIAGLCARLAAERAAGVQIVVLANGDPLFFGIGNTLVRHLGADALAIVPAVSALQAAAARLGLAWEQVRAVSLHGRDCWLGLAHALMAGAPVCVLTDPAHTPGAIARFAIERGFDDYTAEVFSRLGYDDESRWSVSLDVCMQGAYASPNTVFLVPEKAAPAAAGLCARRPLLGRADAAYAQPNPAKGGGLITKWAVRAATLAALRIEPHHTVWDLGAGSGALAVEAAALAHAGQVVAVERHGERIACIYENRLRYRAANLQLVESDICACLADLPAAHRVIVGGGLGGDAAQAAELLTTVWQMLPTGGRICINCVLLQSLERARQILSSLGAPHEITCVQTSRSETLGSDMHLVAQNPVYLVSVEKR